jgi:uncharacterized protein
MSKLVIGDTADGKSLKLDVDLLIPSRLLIQANSGGGKSYLLRRLQEQLYQAKVQAIAIDPEGEFFTLREKFGFVLVGEGGETPADVRSAALLAEKFLSLKVSAVCDLYEAFRAHPMERRRWVAAFLNALLDAPRSLWHPLVIIVDEAHKFCPQETPKAGNQMDRQIIGDCKDAMIALSTTGRKRGFCPIWATQRLAKVDKDASAEFFNRMVGMTIEDVDVDRAADLMSVSREEKHDFRTALRNLEPGQFYCFGRAVAHERTLVKVGPVETYHPETGKAAKNAEAPPMPEEVAKFLPQLSDLPKEAENKARTVADLEKTVRDLRKELKQRPAGETKTETVTVADPRAIVRATKELRTALGEAMKIIAKVTAVGFEGSAVTKEEVEKALQAASTQIVKAAESKIAVRGSEFTRLQSQAASCLEKMRHLLSDEALVAVTVQRNQPFTVAAATTPRAPRPATPLPTNGNSSFSGPESKIMRALCELLSIGKEQPSKNMVAAWAGYSPIGGAFGNPIGALRSKGFIDYPAPGVVTLTDAGRKTVGPCDPPDQEEIWRRIEATCTGPEQKILRALLGNAGQDEISKEQLAEKAGYLPIGGAFGNPIGALRAKGLLDYPRQGVVKAAEWLFL